MTKIPVGQVVADAFRFTFLGLERVIALIWLPIILMTVLGYFAEGPFLTAYAAALDSGNAAQIGPVVARMIGFVAMQLVIQAIIAVAICREVLKPLGRPLWLRFSLGGAELRAFAGNLGLCLLGGLVLLVFVILGVVAGGAMPASGLAGGQQALGVAVLLMLLFSPLLVYLFVRLGGVLVPSVVADGGLGLEKSWLLLKGNVWRLFLVMLAVAIPVALAFVIGQSLIMGGDAANSQIHLGAADKAAQLRQMAESYRQTAAHLPYLKGLEFLLAPFSYGLLYSAPAFAYKALTAKPPV
jgi:hypothetical protein